MNIEIISRIVPKNGQNFPVLEDKYIHGGFHVVDNFSEVSMASRKEGMLICLQSTGKYYKLSGGLDDGYWSEVAISAPEVNAYSYQDTIAALSDGYLLSDLPFSVESDKVYSLGASVTVASTESYLVSNFYYKITCREQAGVIFIDSVNELVSYNPGSYFVVNFATTGLDSVLNVQLVNGSLESVVAKCVVVKENEVSRV